VRPQQHATRHSPQRRAVLSLPPDSGSDVSVRRRCPSWQAKAEYSDGPGKPCKSAGSRRVLRNAMPGDTRRFSKPMANRLIPAGSLVSSRFAKQDPVSGVAGNWTTRSPSSGTESLDSSVQSEPGSTRWSEWCSGRRCAGCTSCGETSTDAMRQANVASATAVLVRRMLVRIVVVVCGAKCAHV
jgi:hypothetical protein